MGFNTWLDTFIDEKGIDPETIMDVTSDGGTDNFIPVGCLVEWIKAQDTGVQGQFKDQVVKIDFFNGDVIDFFKYIAQKFLAFDF